MMPFFNQPRQQKVYGIDQNNELEFPGPDFSNLFGNEPVRVRIPTDFSGLRQRNRMAASEGNARSYVPHTPYVQPGLEKLRNQRMDVVYDPSLELAHKKMELAKRELDIGEASQKGKLALGEKELETEKELGSRKLKLEEFKANNPDWKFQVGKDGFVYAINPQDPSRTLKTDIQSNELSDRDKAALAVSAERVKSERQQKGEMEQIGERGRQERLTQAEKIKATAEKGTLPLDQRRKVANRAQEFVLKNPDIAREFGITIAGDRVNIAKVPSGGIFGFGAREKTDYNKIIESIYGDSSTDKKVDTKEETSLEDINDPRLKNIDKAPLKPGETRNLKPTNDELVPVINPSGKETKIRRSELSRALTQGYAALGEKR